MIILCLTLPVNANANTEDDQYIKNLTVLSNSGHAQAQFTLAGIYVNNKIAEIVKKGVNLYHTSAEKGFVGSQTSLGLIYEFGLHGVDKNLKKSFKWYLLAAQQGEPISQYQVSRMLLDGRGVAENRDQGMEWLQKSAIQDNPDAQLLLGVLYLEGDSVLQDYQKAFNFLDRSAKKGNSRAQAVLGTLYFEGKGIEKNSVIGYARLNLAASKDPEASSLRDIVAKELDAKNLENAQKLSREYQSLYSSRP